MCTDMYLVRIAPSYGSFVSGVCMTYWHTSCFYSLCGAGLLWDFRLSFFFARPTPRSEPGAIWECCRPFRDAGLYYALRFFQRRPLPSFGMSWYAVFFRFLVASSPRSRLAGVLFFKFSGVPFRAPRHRSCAGGFCV